MDNRVLCAKLTSLKNSQDSVNLCKQHQDYRTRGTKDHLANIQVQQFHLPDLQDIVIHEHRKLYNKCNESRGCKSEIYARVTRKLVFSNKR